MKKTIILILIALAVITGSAHARKSNTEITFNYFYSTLVPYGEWVELDYDLYAWRPDRMGRGWQPYSVGRWVWSDYGWYWDSYEPFGWAVYHYGRWYNDEYYGWIWIPDDNWGPSWVEWRYSDDYIGWAPLPPYAEFRAGIGIHFTFDWHCYPRHWNYVRYGHFHDYNIHHHLLPDRMKIKIYDRTRYRNDYDYRDGRVINRGVDRGHIERRSGTRFTERRIEEVSRLRDYEGARRNGSDRRTQDRIEVYRPSQQEINNTRDLKKTDIRRSGRPTSLELSRVENREMVREMRRNSGGQERQNTNSERGNTDRRNKDMNPSARPDEDGARQRVPDRMEPRAMPENRGRDRSLDEGRSDNPPDNARQSHPRRQETESRPQAREKRNEEQSGEERKDSQPRREENRAEQSRPEERRIERSRPSERPAADSRKDQENDSRREERGSRNEGGRRR